MTAQIHESLIYEGREVSMCSTPLDAYFIQYGIPWPFQAPSTALLRGYVGSWEIVENRLYVASLGGTLSDGSGATLPDIFPDSPCPVFADWYSGTIRIPEGGMLEYVHMGYESTYERDLFLELENGVVVGQHLRVNGIAPPAPPGPPEPPSGWVVVSWWQWQKDLLSKETQYVYKVAHTDYLDDLPPFWELASEPFETKEVAEAEAELRGQGS